MFYFIGGDGQEYGPVDVEQLKQWISEGRLIASTPAKKEGSHDYRDIASYEEFQGEFGSVKSAPQLPAKAAAPQFTEPTTSPAPAPETAQGTMPGPPSTSASEGLPWEQKESPFLHRLLDTIKGVLFSPSETFEKMKKTGNMMDALLYCVMLFSIGNAVGLILQLPLNMALEAIGAKNEMDFFAGMFGQGIGTAVAIFLIPFFTAIWFFLWAGLQHLTLWMFGGGKHGYETTACTYGYSIGSTAAFMMIPFCGAYVAGIWGIVVNIIGLAKTQEISTGKAAAAVLIPVLFCCIVGVVIGVAVFVVAGAAIAAALANQ